MPIMENSAKPEARIRAALELLPSGQPCLLALSGGMDSSVLLHALVHLRPDLSLRAAHVDHGLQPDSHAWAQHCHQQCQAYAVPFLNLQLQSVVPTGNLEAWARQQRYHLLQEQLKPQEVLLTAHHLRDQAETLLLNLLRGSGLAGLAAMPVERKLGQHRLLRPLLSVHPDDLSAYAEHHKLAFIDDPSNQNRRFDRNFIRHEVLAALEERFPHALSNMARSAGFMAEAVQDDEGLDLQGSVLPIEALLSSDGRLDSRRLLAWLRVQGLPSPRHRMLGQIQQQLAATPDRNPLIAWPGAELRRYRENVHVMRPLAPTYPLSWSDLPPNDERDWPWGGRLRWQLPAGAWRIGCLQGGEKLRLQGHKRRIKNLFQQAAVPPWQRARWPVLFRGEECIAVANRWRSGECRDFGFDWDSGWTEERSI